MAKFLIVDDAKLPRMMLKNILVEAGHQIVAEAINGLEGETMYFEHKPDVVTLDIVMPEVGGIECLKNIIAKDPEAKIIMVSSVGKDSTVDEALQIGAKQFVTKPFDKEKVLKAVALVL